VTYSKICSERCDVQHFSVAVFRNVTTHDTVGRVMAQAVSRQPLITKAGVRDRVRPCGICGGQSGTGTGFSMSSLVFFCQYHFTVVPYRYIIWWMNNRPVGGRSSETPHRRERPVTQFLGFPSVVRSGAFRSSGRTKH
jgi:hypothetical protein